MNHKQRSSPIIGGTSLITVFSVLCLVIFVLLTLSTVSASKRLADASHDAVSAYYNADCKAEEIFAKLRSGIIPDNVTVNGNFYSYQCTITNTQYLLVELSHINGNWNIIKWCAVVATQ
jgi:hypothetical protein